MRSVLVVVLAEVFSHDLGFEQCCEFFKGK
jgi:hypothetical protein